MSLFVHGLSEQYGLRPVAYYILPSGRPDIRHIRAPTKHKHLKNVEDADLSWYLW